MPNLLSRRIQGRVARSRLFQASIALLLGTAACDSLGPAISLMLSQPSVQFRVVRGNSTLQTQTITVSNTGGGRLGPVSCPESPAPWLFCSVAQGNVVTFTANPTGLTTSPAPVVVPLTAPGVAEPTSVTVELIIQEPVITLSPNTLAFTANEGSSSANPPAATVTITNSGAGGLIGLGTVSCVPAQPGSRVSCAVNQGTGALTVSVDPNGLAPGTYIYALTVSSPNAGVSQNLQVSLRVVAQPRIVLSQRTVHFQAIRGLTGTQTQTVTVTNSGEGSLGTVSCPPSPTSWLSCSVSAGTGGATTVTFTANPAGVNASPNPATVNISATGAVNSPQGVTVTMALEQPLLELSTNTVTFSAIETAGGGTVTPPFQTVGVTARTASGTPVGPGNITCTPQNTGASPFVTCAVPPGSNQITLSADPGAATPGTYIRTVNVTGSNSDVTQRVTVVVTVTPRPDLILTPSILTFRVTGGSTSLQELRSAVSNAGGGSLGDVSCPPTSPVLWATCRVEGQEVIITVNPSGFTESPPPGVFSITASAIPNQPKPLTVDLVVLQQMALSANTASFTVSAGGQPQVPAGTTTTPASVTITVMNTTGTLQALGVIGCGAPAFITCVINQAAGQVQFSLNPAGITPGSYAYQTNISATRAGNSPLPVTINLTVNP
jgi:hypothetical protein